MPRLASALLVSACVLGPASAASAQPATPAPLSAEQIASYPSLIGTAPSSPTWSRDSQWLAFRWNEEGWPFRDLYVVGADGRNRRRLTNLQQTHPAPPPPSGTSTEALAAQSAARARGGISEVLWLPDHRALLFTASGRLFRVGLDGNAPVVLPAGEGLSDIALSPDGSRLSYLKDGDLWVWPLSGGNAERLTTVGIAGPGTVPLGSYNKPDAEVGTGVWGADWMPYQWSPDGRTIALHMVDRRHIRQVRFPWFLGGDTGPNILRRGYPGDENERRTLALLDVSTRRLQPLPLPAPGARAISDYEWSSTGRLMIDQVSDTGTDRWFWVLEPGATTPREVWHDQRDTRIYPAYVSRWHPDGRRIVFVADLTERDHLYSLEVDRSGATPQALTSGDWDVAGERGAAPLSISADGTITFTSTQASPYDRQVYQLVRGTGAPVAITSRGGVHVPSLSPDGRHLATLWSDDVTPTELLVRPAQPAATDGQVTRSPRPAFSDYAWVRPRYETFRNAVDGFVVHARILEPAGLDRSRRHPVIFGPLYSNTVRNRWAGLSGTLQQAMVQRGYIVVQVDVRGSVGYGRAFREAFLMDYGGKDLDDIEAVVRGLAQRPYVDASRMGLWGSSYGGLLTVFTLLKKPGLFAAGVAGAPATDPFAFGPDDIAITRTPASHPDAFVRGSAQHLGDGLRDHLLIIHGVMDDVVPFRTTMTLIERLILLGKDVDLATAPAATHGWTAREPYAIFFYRKLLNYFDQHLAPAR
jgi:dipeptidyl-peptidase-4